MTLQLDGKLASDEYASRADCGERIAVKQSKGIKGFSWVGSEVKDHFVPRDRSPRDCSSVREVPD